MKKEWYKALIFWGIAFMILFAIQPIASAENLYSSVIRIHVVANSDSPRDQAVKLAVRDGIVAYAKENFSEVTSKKEAEVQIGSHLKEIEILAAEIVEKAGESLPVTAILENEVYPTREYEALALPAGEYLSLQIRIGDATGQNWWCVLFPPMCLNSAIGAEDALLDAGMEGENVRLITRDGESYRVRFKILELWQEAKTKLKGIF
ncbi:MAG: stage II sporulation protein R [Clostridia bacterium]|nr:stage II sporulation protein R [Clostridia bacterium]